jgi:tRNA 2-selenouridine synthase
MVVESLNTSDFLQQAQNRLIVDVRSPIEFKKGHIPGAMNIPLFEDIERAEIGTLYKQKGKDSAVMRGLEIVSPKLTEFITTVKNNANSKHVFIYCFRGGMRSNSFGWLLNTSGLNSTIMQGGYKAYRNFILSQFAFPMKLILLGGATGSGKTEILHELKNSVQYVDLENLANHKGSSFGNINLPPQLPQQLFENNLYDDLKKLDRSKLILVEDESMSIGYNKIPYEFWLQMKASPAIKLVVPFELRVQRLVDDYGKAPLEKLKQSLLNISSQIGPDNTTKCLKDLDAGNMADVARVTLVYYDKAYSYNFTKREAKTVFEIVSDTDDIKTNALKVKAVFDDYAKR